MTQDQVPTSAAPPEHSDNCLSWHGPPNECDCGVGGFASDGVEIRGLRSLMTEPGVLDAD